MLNGRPFCTVFNSEEKIDEILLSYSFYLNSDLRMSPKSIPSYIKDLHIFLEFLHEEKYLREFFNNPLFFTKVTSYHINQFLFALKNKGYKDSTLRSCDARLRHFFKWLYSFKSEVKINIERHPYADGRYKTPNPNRSHKKFIMANELIDFINHSFKDERDCVLAHFMFDTGARISEAARVRLSHLVDPNDFPIECEYLPQTIIGSKGRGEVLRVRESLLTRVVANRLWRYWNNCVKPNLSAKELRQSDPLIFRNSIGNPIEPKSITDKYYQKSKSLIKLGIITSTITPHRLRHGSAVSIIRSELGKDLLDKLVIVKKNHGHINIKTTEIYGNASIDVLMRLRDVNKDKEIKTRVQEAENIFNKTDKIKYDGKF
jgi:integrase/recombinase XerC